MPKTAPCPDDCELTGLEHVLRGVALVAETSALVHGREAAAGYADRLGSTRVVELQLRIAMQGAWEAYSRSLRATFERGYREAFGERFPVRDRCGAYRTSGEAME